MKRLSSTREKNQLVPNIFLIAIGFCPSADPATDLGIFGPKAFGVAICDFVTLSCARSKDALHGGC